jgi:hypothetical protein
MVNRKFSHILLPAYWARLDQPKRSTVVVKPASQLCPTSLPIFQATDTATTKGQAENFLGALYHCLKVPGWSITELDRDWATQFKKHSVIANIEKVTGKTGAARWLKAFEAGTQVRVDRFCGAAGKTSKAGAEHTLSMYGAIAGLGWATKEETTTNNNK